MTKEEVKELIEKSNKTVYVVGLAQGTNPNWDKGIWRKFAIYVVVNNELMRLYFESKYPDAPPHWIPRHKTKSGRWVGGYFESNALGMDRVAEIVMSLSYWLYNDNYELDFKFLSGM